MAGAAQALDLDLSAFPPAVVPPSASPPAAAVTVPTPFPGGGGMLPGGASTDDPAVWARWTSGYKAPADGKGIGMPTQAAGGGSAVAAIAGSAQVKAPPSTLNASQSKPLTSRAGDILGVGDLSSFAETLPPPQPVATPTGIIRNTGAGLVKGAAAVADTLSDPFGNLVGRPLATAIQFGHDALAPVFGYPRYTEEQRNALLAQDVPQPGTALTNAAAKLLGTTQPDQVTGTPFEQGLNRAVTGATTMLSGGPAMMAQSPHRSENGQVAERSGNTLRD